MEGKTVALVSSGDPGIYGMAGLVLEMAWAEKLQVQIEIIPGVTSAGAAAAALGAPLMLDYATISLSDILVPWETIRARLEAVAAADFRCCSLQSEKPKTDLPVGKGFRYLPEIPSGRDAGRDCFRSWPRRATRDPDRSGPFSGSRYRNEKRRDHRKQDIEEPRWPVYHAAGLQTVILLIGGTSDTAPIATGLANAGFRILVSTATDIPLDTGSHPRIARRCGFLDASGWSALIREHGFELVVDAAHPFATGVHALIRQEASKAGVPCIAYERPAGGCAGKTGVIRTTGHDKAAAIACRLGKPILLTTGTKDLLPYVRGVRRTGAFLHRARPAASAIDRGLSRSWNSPPLHCCRSRAFFCDRQPRDHPAFRSGGPDHKRQRAFRRGSGKNAGCAPGELYHCFDRETTACYRGYFR